MAVRYSDKTMRRSSSNQRGSRLPDRSIAPPVRQNLFQFRTEATTECPKVGIALTSILTGEKAQTSSNSLKSRGGMISNSCFVVLVIVPPSDQPAAA